MIFGPEQLFESLRGLPAAQRYWVGFSGGLDSSVLLQALARLRPRLGGELHAVHVNHHIHRDSGEWQAHCRAQCAALGVALVCRDVQVVPAHGESLEAVARERRYHVYRELLEVSDLLLLAHHEDDQLETFFLQALRGAGVRGLAAMPRLAACGAGQLARPLLGFTRAELRVWAEAQGFPWLEDPANTELRFDRNYLRAQVLPVLKVRWPAAAETVSRSARHCAEAAELLAAQARADWQQTVEAGRSSLPLAPLMACGHARAKNLLRHWLDELHLPLPSEQKLEQIFAEVAGAGKDRNPCVRWCGVELRRYRGRLYAMPPLRAAPHGEWHVRPEEELSLGGGLGVLSLHAARGEGLDVAKCPATGFTLRFRAGGEACQPAGRAHRRPLKKWLQEFQVLPWMRARLPLLYADGELAAVAGLFVCAPFAAAAGAPGLRIVWQGGPAPAE